MLLLKCGRGTDSHLDRTFHEDHPHRTQLDKKASSTFHALAKMLEQLEKVD
jgi:hypothetical protein